MRCHRPSHTGWVGDAGGPARAAARDPPKIPGITAAERCFAGAGQTVFMVDRVWPQHVFGKIWVRSFQRRAGPRPARHEHRLATAGETRLPVCSVTLFGDSVR
eukprot:gene13072-biopygen1964